MGKISTIVGVLLLSLLAGTRLSAQVLLTEDFNFSGKLTSNGWTANSAGGTNADTTTTGLVYVGHLGSGIGNAVLINNKGGEDDNRPLSDSLWHNGDVAYLSFLVNITDTASNSSGDYFINLGYRNSPTSVSGYSARFFARIVNDSVNFGLTTSGTPIYGATNFAKDTTYLVIVKYSVNTNGNDTTSAWVFLSGVPTTEASAGTPLVTDNSTTGSDVINAVVLRQGSSGTYPQLVVDDIRIVKSWTSINYRLAVLSKRSSNFGMVPIGTSAKDTVIVKNDDDTALVISKVTSGSSLFVVSPSGKATLPIGFTHQYVITYTPTAAVTSSSWIVWTSSASSSPDSVSVSGTGFSASVTVSTHSYSFGNVFAGSTAVDSVTVTNLLSTSVTIDSVTSSNPLFTVGPVSSILAVGDSMKFGVSFKPTAAGIVSSSIAFYGGGAMLANPLTVSGNGIIKAPHFSASATLKDFHGVLVGHSWKDSIIVKNTGYDSLFIAAVTSTNPVFTVTPTSARMDTQASKSFYITFTPTALTAKSSSIVFASNVTEATDTVSAIGRGASYVSIAEVRKDSNNDLIPDHSITGDTLFATGVITSRNLQAAGSQTAIFIQDSTAGVEVFAYGLPPIPMAIGDSVFVIGTVDQYHGATEFEPLNPDVLDTLHFGILKHNASVPKAKHLSLHQFVANSENYEGLFVEIDTLYKVSGTWPPVATGAAIYVTDQSKADTAELYISSSTDIGGSREPAYPINVTAIINQYSSSTTVYNDGYEIEPSDTSNILSTSIVTIAEARKDVNHDLIADHSVTKDTLQIYGVVTTPNLQSVGSHTAYFIQDATAGIEVFDSLSTSKSYAIGDSVMVKGTVAQYRGLVQFVPLVLDTVHFAVLKHNAKKPTAQHLTLHQLVTNAESYEGSLVEVDTLYYTSGTWPLASSDGTLYVTNASKADTIEMFTSSSTNIAGSTARIYPINVIGVISQYTSAATVYNNGYELEPFDTTNIIHTPGTTDVPQNSSNIPGTYELYNNYPNPFNPSTTIMYGLPQKSYVTVKVYSILGQEVRTLVNDFQSAAYYHITWDGTGNSGMQVSSGVYFFRIIAEPTDGKGQTFTQVKKMVLLK